MSLNIKVFNGDYKITSDSYNVIVNKLISIDLTKSPKREEGDSKELRYEYREITYQPKVDSALKSLAEHKIRQSGAETLGDLRHEIQQIYRDISANYNVHGQ